ncbi:hypothetical protein C7M84_008554 [Penaeus vannamei]|uniref:Uncharacterized protein n=1 Tax=Penaeus vannamei TaxID=6689 RepID=A0A423UAG0_PENVA|nr:hypothetical protein C7M84_008554 [Penaeus vannamei]
MVHDTRCLGGCRVYSSSLFSTFFSFPPSPPTLSSPPLILFLAFRLHCPSLSLFSCLSFSFFFPIPSFFRPICPSVYPLSSSFPSFVSPHRGVLSPIFSSSSPSSYSCFFPFSSTFISPFPPSFPSILPPPHPLALFLQFLPSLPFYSLPTLPFSSLFCFLSSSSPSILTLIILSSLPFLLHFPGLSPPNDPAACNYSILLFSSPPFPSFPSLLLLSYFPFFPPFTPLYSLSLPSSSLFLFPSPLPISSLSLSLLLPSYAPHRLVPFLPFLLHFPCLPPHRVVLPPPISSHSLFLFPSPSFSFRPIPLTALPPPVPFPFPCLPLHRVVPPPVTLPLPHSLSRLPVFFSFLLPPYSALSPHRLAPFPSLPPSLPLAVYPSPSCSFSSRSSLPSLSVEWFCARIPPPACSPRPRVQISLGVNQHLTA